MVKQKAKKYEFDAIMKEAGGGWIYVDFPFDAKKEFGVGGRVKITASIDGESYKGSLASAGEGKHALVILKSIREKIVKGAGDSIHVILEQDIEEEVIEVPVALQKLLTSNIKAKAIFENLSVFGKKEYARWITEPKRDATRVKRLSQVEELLLSGKKYPTEK